MCLYRDWLKSAEILLSRTQAVTLLGKVQGGKECQRLRSVILTFTLRVPPSMNLGGLEGRLEVGQCRYSLTLLSKVQAGKECQWFWSVILAFTLRVTPSANLGNL